MLCAKDSSMWHKRTSAYSLVTVALVGISALVMACSSGNGTGAENDDDPNLPGIFVPSQGRTHLNHTFSLSVPPKPFCEGVASSQSPAGTAAVVDFPTPEPNVENPCYSSNPPSSGWHLGVQRNVD